MSVGRAILIGSAFSPLPLVLGIRADDPAASAGLIGIGLVMAAGLPMVVWRARRSTAWESMRPNSLRETTSRSADYVVLYLLPFALVVNSGIRDYIAFVLLLALVVVSYSRTDQLAVNPWLAIFRYRVFKGEVGSESRLYLHKGYLDPDIGHSVVPVVQGLFYIPKISKESQDV